MKIWFYTAAFNGLNIYKSRHTHLQYVVPDSKKLFPVADKWNLFFFRFQLKTPWQHRRKGSRAVTNNDYCWLIYHLLIFFVILT